MAFTSSPCLLLLLLLIATAVSAAPAAGTSKVPAIIVFGDSSVDAGNNNQIPTVLKSNFPPYGRDFYGGRATGRFGNGRLPPDFISEAFGLRPFVPAYLDPMYHISDFAVGVCFASAGTGYDNATSDVLSVIPLSREIEYYKEYQNKLRAYLGVINADTILREALYLISLGTNDFLENYYTTTRRRSQFTIAQFQEFLIRIAENFIREIYRLGARKVSLGGLPPMGCLPLERTTNVVDGKGDVCIDKYNAVALSFNGKLNRLVQKLNRELPEIRLVFSNPYFVFLQIIQRPSFYGFEVASRGCCATGTYEMGPLCNIFSPFTCKDASKYVFWDAFHPTEKTNSIISDHVIRRVLNVFL